MKRIVTHGCFAAVVALVLAAAANAQIGREYKAEIPFDFSMNGKTWEAGEYTVGPLSGNSSQLPLALRHSKSGKASVIGLVSAQAGNGDDRGHLYFNQIGGAYSLIQVSTPTFEFKTKRARTDVRIVADRKGSRTVAIAMR